MRATPQRLMATALWPLTLWPSVLNMDKHPADDYAERTFPLIATAVAFWICVGFLLYLLMQTGTLISIDDGEGMYMQARLIPRWIDSFAGVLWFFLPALYIIGLWLYAARDEAFPR